MDSVVKLKSLAFAKRVIKLYKYLCDDLREFVLSKQILRSGTSIGANITEAQCGFSRKDFLFKMQTAYKECAETLYWLELLYSSDYLSKDEYNSINSDCLELMSLLSSITKTTKEKL